MHHPNLVPQMMSQLFHAKFVVSEDTGFFIKGNQCKQSTVIERVATVTYKLLLI